MSRTNLVRRQVIDRNGVATTRWVKPSGVAGAVDALPAPQVAPRGLQKLSTPELSTILSEAEEKIAANPTIENYWSAVNTVETMMATTGIAPETRDESLSGLAASAATLIEEYRNRQYRVHDEIQGVIVSIWDSNEPEGEVRRIKLPTYSNDWQWEVSQSLSDGHEMYLRRVAATIKFISPETLTDGVPDVKQEYADIFQKVQEVFQSRSGSYMASTSGGRGLKGIEILGIPTPHAVVKEEFVDNGGSPPVADGWL